MKNNAQHFTPKWLSEMISHFFIDKKGLYLDPAVGTGVLLAPYTDVLKIGVDIDGTLKDVNEHNGVEFISSDFLMSFERDIKMADAIIANPPFIRHHQISAQQKGVMTRFLEKIGLSIDRRCGVHVYFLLAALSKMANDGKAVFILPSDVFDGAFSSDLWKWITKRYNLVEVWDFDNNTNPFPNVDIKTYVVFFNGCGKTNKVQYKTISSKEYNPVMWGHSFNIEQLLNVGLSRPYAIGLEQDGTALSDIANIKRGIATGNNNFFLFTSEKINQWGIPQQYFKRTIVKNRDVRGTILTMNDLNELDAKGVHTFILDLNGYEYDDLPNSVCLYLESGVKNGVPTTALLKTKKHWWMIEKRDAPQFLFSYLGGVKNRFVLNDAGVIPLNTYHCVYLKNFTHLELPDTLELLNSENTINNLKLIGKSYGGGSIKVEPSKLGGLICKK